MKNCSPVAHREFLDELATLSRNIDVVCEPDKGRRVILVDKSRCLQSLHNTIGDVSKFVPISENARNC